MNDTMRQWYVLSEEHVSKNEINDSSFMIPWLLLSSVCYTDSTANKHFTILILHKHPSRTQLLLSAKAESG